jgi:hypothetical protein
LRACSAAAWGLEVAFIIVPLGYIAGDFRRLAAAEPRTRKVRLTC